MVVAMDILQEVKNRLSVSGEFHDNMLNGYIDDVKHFMLGSGIKESVVESKKSVGCIAKGVSDLWLDGTFSETFKQRLIQLTFEVEDVQAEE
jgi:hypothetical protein